MLCRIACGLRWPHRAHFFWRKIRGLRMADALPSPGTDREWYQSRILISLASNTETVFRLDRECPSRADWSYFCDRLDAMVGRRRRGHELGAQLFFDSHCDCFLLPAVRTSDGPK